VSRNDDHELYEDGDVVVRQGELGSVMYVVVSGEVQIFRTQGGVETDLATLRTGETFGELALFDNRPRSASARAVGKTELRAINREEFSHMKCDPLLRELMTTLAHRLRATDLAFERLNVREAPEREQLAAFWESRDWIG
jgi:CRP-like cAMP-binding protein